MKTEMTLEEAARTARLHALMKEHKLKSPAVAKILTRSTDMVRKWRNGYRVIPKHMLELLEFRVTVAANDAPAPRTTKASA